MVVANRSSSMKALLPVWTNDMSLPEAAGAIQPTADHGCWTLPDPALDDQELACDWARGPLAAPV